MALDLAGMTDLSLLPANSLQLIAPKNYLRNVCLKPRNFLPMYRYVDFITIGLQSCKRLTARRLRKLQVQHH